MKKLFTAVIALFAASGAWAGNPYIQGIWTKGNPIYTTTLIGLNASSFKYEATYQNIVPLYHPVSAGSIIPAVLQPYIPPESWACTSGVGGLNGTGLNQPSARFAVGCGLNLLDSARQEISVLLAKSSNPTAQGIAKALAVNGASPVDIYFSRIWADSVQRPGRFVPEWGTGLALGLGGKPATTAWQYTPPSSRILSLAYND